MRSALRWMLACFALCAPMMASAGTASGTLEVNGKVFHLKHAYGVSIEDWTDRSKAATLLIVSDKPVPEKILNERVSIFDLRDAGVNGLKFEFYSGGENYAMMIVGAGVEGSVSSSGTFDSSQFTKFEPTKIAGKVRDEKSFGDTNLKYELNFESDVMPRTPKENPSAEDMKAAQNTESAKAYISFNEAVREGDLDAIRAGVVPERAEQMDTPQFKEMLGFVQSMMPSDIKVLTANETGDTAELAVTGKDDDVDKEGVVTLRRLNGKWLVEGESWR